MIDVSIVTYDVPIVRPFIGSDGLVNPIMVEIVERARLTVDIGDFRWFLEALPGFRFDGASIPGPLQMIYGAPTSPRNLCLGWPHDLLFALQLFPRETCNVIMYKVSILIGVETHIAREMYEGVEWFGESAWNGHVFDGPEIALKHFAAHREKKP